MIWAPLDIDLPSSPAMMIAAASVGDAALAFYASALAYAKRHLTDGLIPLKAYRSLTHHAHPGRVAQALLDAGLLESHGEDVRIVGYADQNPTRAEVSPGSALDVRRNATAPRATGADRQRAYRERRRGERTNGDVTRDAESVTRDAAGDVARDAKSVTGDAVGDTPLPSQTLPTPARENTNTGTNSPPSPAGGDGDRVTDSGRDGGQTPPATEPVEADEPVDPDSKSAKVLARLKTYARAYTDGLSLATGGPVPSVLPLFEMRALGAAASCAKDANGKLLRGEALLTWFRDQARMYATVRAEAAQFERGFAPSKFLQWLSSGAKTKPSTGNSSRFAPIQPSNPAPFVRRYGEADPTELPENWNGDEWIGPPEHNPYLNDPTREVT